MTADPLALSLINWAVATRPRGQRLVSLDYTNVIGQIGWRSGCRLAYLNRNRICSTHPSLRKAPWPRCAFRRRRDDHPDHRANNCNGLGRVTSASEQSVATEADRSRPRFLLAGRPNWGVAVVVGVPVEGHGVRPGSENVGTISV